MAPDEAKLLELLKNKLDIYYITFRVEDSKTHHYRDLSLKLTGLEQEISTTPQKLLIHLENLVSLSIIEDIGDGYKVDEEGYNNLIKKYDEAKTRYEEKINNNEFGDLNQLKIHKSYYNITALGKIFIKACSPLEKN